MRRPRFSFSAPVAIAAAFVVATMTRSDVVHGAPAAEGSGTTVAAPAASSANPATFDADMDGAVRALAHHHGLGDAQIGAVVIDSDSGRVLAAYNEHLPLNPASNAKVVTAAAALALLHGDHRYTTTLSGTTKSGAVTGGLVLRGHGDPSLRTEDLFAFALDLRAHGIRRIDGDVVVDQKFHDDNPVPPAFDQKPDEWATFRAPISAVGINENTVTMTVRPAQEAGGQAQVSFDPPGFVDVDGTVKTSEPGADNVILALAPNGKRLAARVAGTVAVDSKLVRYTRCVDDPQLLAGYTLRAMLEQAGIKVSGDVRAGTAKANVLVDHDSAPLSELLYSVGKNSDNFYAEMIFKSISGEMNPKKPAKSGDSAELVTKWLEKQGLLDQGAVIKNGSGLYDANRVTTSMLANVIRYAIRDSSIGPEYVAQLAIGGVDGTLHKRFLNRRAHRAIRAKTGTLDDVIALSGVVYGPPGKSPIVFSVLCNKVGGKGATAREAIDAMVRAIYDKQWGGAD
jgi:D-alanyl-D-alanine carboxypeptidase/D-alanyl-D-alanine-endopeptidase (penicillin-binding protein 4)